MATEVERLVVSLEASITKYERAMQRALGETNKTAKQIEGRFAQMSGKLGTSFAGSLKGLGAGLLAGVSVRAITQASAAYVDIQNQLRVAGLEGAKLTGVFNELFAVAQKNGTGLAPLVTLYSRAAQAQKELGATSGQLMQFTNGVSLALRVAGTDSTKASGALLQLSQALGSSRVQAEEFNSINEGARPILQAVADGLIEAGGSVSTLKQLVTDGKISNEIFFNAFLAGMSGLEEKAAKALPTVGQATERVTNAFMLLVGELDKTTGASSNAAAGLNGVADVITQLPALVDAAVAGLATFEAAMVNIGNSEAARRLGELLGADYSAAGVRAAGLIPIPGKGGADMAGALGIDAVTAPIENTELRGRAGMANRPVPPVSLKDFKAPAGTGKTKTAKKAKKDTEDAYERETRQIQEQTEALKLELGLVGQTEQARDKARVALDLENAAKRAGVELTAQHRAKIDELSTAYAAQAEAVRRVQESQEKAEAAAQEFYSTFKDSITGAITGANSFSEALSQIMKKLQDMVLSSAFDAIFKPATSSSSGGSLGGIFSSIGKMLGFEEGGFTGAGGKNEPAGVVHRGEYVMDAATVRKLGVGNLDTLRKSLKGYASGGYVGGISAPRLPPMPARSAASSSTDARQYNIDARGAEAGVEQKIAAMLVQYDKQAERALPGRMVNAQRRMS